MKCDILPFSLKLLNEGKYAGELWPQKIRAPAQLRDWEEQRKGALGEESWDYTDVMENTSFRYVRKLMAAKRIREVGHETLFPI